jgi:hypothetical protein
MNCTPGEDGQMHQVFQVTVHFGNTMENWTATTGCKKPLISCTLRIR